MAERSKVALEEALGQVLAHDVTEIRPGECKGPAFRKGHIVRREDIPHLRRLGKEHLFVLTLGADELHEDEAASALAAALMGDGVMIAAGPREGKISLAAARDGLLRVDTGALLEFNRCGEVICATLHDRTVVKQGQVVAETKAIPLTVKKGLIDRAVKIAGKAGGILSVKPLRRPRAGLVITGNEIHSGLVRDAFAPVLESKLKAYRAEIVGLRYAPDDEQSIARNLQELLGAGADLLIVTGGLSVDPDDVTRFAVRELGAVDITYGAAAFPGAMFLVAYLPADQGREPVPLLGIPACGMYHRTTVFDLILPRVLAGERIGREELAELGHGGLCRRCPECRYPACPFGK